MFIKISLYFIYLLYVLRVLFSRNFSIVFGGSVSSIACVIFRCDFIIFETEFFFVFQKEVLFYGLDHINYRDSSRQPSTEGLIIG